MYSYLHKQVALGAWLHWRAVDRHGFTVTRELQGELFLHQLSDHLTHENKEQRGRRGEKKEIII